MRQKIRLNIETQEPHRVVAELMNASTTYIAKLVNRVSRDIVEIDLTSTEPRAISLENIKEILYWLPSYKIRFTIG